ncbi:MAG: alpha/beta fold hydrolase [Acidimicrobiia bacterium]|nr:alpha/beta fold hydrolase [Acidimicrobiia bacterium]
MRAVVISVITALGLLVAIPGAAVAEPEAIDWEPCYQQAGPNFECAVVRLPLDHDEPGGTSIPIAVAKLSATDPENRIGSLFLNPGGPGGSGVDFLLGAGPVLFTDEVRSQFDLIGFDPRGVRRSAPLKCFRSFGDLAGLSGPPFPINEAEYLLMEAVDMAAVELCDANARSIIDHMSTADVARDMDALREMLGDEQMTYFGVSYGSFLGNTYANLFPDNVRAVVIDAVLDPIAWTTGAAGEEGYPFSYRLRSDQGAQDTLDEFFRLCDEAGTAGCALAPDSGARFAALADQLLNDGPIFVDPGSGELVPFFYQDLIGSTLGPLYNSASWPSHAEFLAFIEAGASPAVLGEALTRVRELSGSFDFPNAPYPGFEQFLGVSCSDSDNPDDHAAWFAAGQDADANYGYFGSLWTWASGPCAVWNGVADDRYVGPFDAATANPVLVVGTRYDPATRYEGAVIADDLLANSALLTVEGWGHTSLFLSQCADEAIAAYLVDVTVPDDGATCFQDFGPFDTALSANDLARQEFRAQMMQQIALHPGR